MHVALRSTPSLRTFSTIFITLSFSAIPALAELTEFQAGLAEYKLSNYGQATLRFRRSVKQNDSPQSHYWLGQSLYMSGQRTEGLDEFWTLVRTFPRSREMELSLTNLRKLDPDFQKHYTESIVKSTKVPSGGSTASKNELIDSILTLQRPLENSRPEVDKSFVEDVKATLQQIPFGILFLLASKGCKIYIAPTVLDNDMRMQHVHPGGYELDSGIKQARGRFDMHDVVVGEYVYDLQGNLQKVADSRATVLHEVGHAFDVYNQDMSDRDPYKHDWWIASKPWYDKKLAYFCRSGRAGPAETLAELFCIKYGGRKDESTNELPSYVPRCVADLNAEIERITKKFDNLEKTQNN